MNEILKGLNQGGLRPKETRVVGPNRELQLDARPLEFKEQANQVLDTETLLTTSGLNLKNDSMFDLGGADNRMKAILNPHSLIGEQYRMLRAKLSLMQKQSGVRTLLITSAVNSEGKTLLSCGLAAVLAQEPGRRVLLVDADLRKPDVYRFLGLIGEDRFSGVSRMLQGEVGLEEVVMSSKSGDLYLLPAGPIPPNPAELLSSRHFEQALKEAKRFFDWIVIDSPPVLPLSDTTMLAPLCDTALLVVNAKATPAKLVKSAIQMIGREKFCGVVLNHVRDLKTSSFYYYYQMNHTRRRQK